MRTLAIDFFYRIEQVGVDFAVCLFYFVFADEELFRFEFCSVEFFGEFLYGLVAASLNFADNVVQCNVAVVAVGPVRRVEDRVS